jgi:hypothetical protein
MDGSNGESLKSEGDAMFHRYIIASNGRKIDIDRASYLMDKSLAGQVYHTAMEGLGLAPFDFATAKRMGCKPPRATEAAILQAIWNEYCRAHFNKHGSAFIPNADPHWDS